MIRWRPAKVTLALAGLAAGSVVLLHADPWAEDGRGIQLVSTQSVARRLFPNLGERELAQASVEIARADGATIRLLPTPEGAHQLFVGEALLGSADPEAIEGLWGSLRMATTLRAVSPGTRLGAIRGTIEIVSGDERLILRLADATSDGAGIFGVLVHEQETPWVVEAELLAIVEQEPEAWLAQRLVPIEPSQAVALRWPDRAISRGADGLWRVSVGEPRLLLATATVETRLDRLFAARLAPLIAREALREEELAEWLTIEDADGRERRLRVGGECPEDNGRRIVDRGPGMLGCVDAALIEPWPLSEPNFGFVEPLLIPHPYSKVTAIEVLSPESRRLRRFGGGWVIEAGGRTDEVVEAEVYRWFDALASTPVELGGEAIASAGAVELAIETDSGQGLKLRCSGDRTTCSRDEGPPLRLLRPAPRELVFREETFAERRLMAIDAGEARALEILPGVDGAARQGVRLDLGVWRLDAPSHPDGGGALDELRLEGLIAALGSARAEEWVAAPSSPPLRTLRVERAPTRDRPRELALALHAECLAHVPGQGRAARLSRETCEALSSDLLYDDPLRHWLGRARTIVVARGDERWSLRAGGGGAWIREAGGDDEAVAAALAAWEAWRSAGIRGGEPPGASSERLELRLVDGLRVNLELGPTWLRIAGSDWYYVARAE